MQNSVVAAFQAVLCTVLLVIVTNASLAQVMTSGSYQIESDSINVAGGFASSTNYQLETTVGEQATGESSSNSYLTRAGFQQMQGSYIAITAGAPVTMSPSIPGVAGGAATGSTAVTVTTDSLAGYELTIAAANDPAMQSETAVIADYAPSGGTADFNFTTGSADAHFGFTPEGSDIIDRFLDSGGVCGSGSDTTDRCWDGVSTSPQVIARGGSANHPSGTETTIKFRVEVGGSVIQEPGVYVATTTLTALPL